MTCNYVDSFFFTSSRFILSIPAAGDKIILRFGNSVSNSSFGANAIKHVIESLGWPFPEQNVHSVLSSEYFRKRAMGFQKEHNSYNSNLVKLVALPV